MNKSTTYTPRTDEEMWTTDYHHELCNVVNTEFARQLERELSHSLANQLKTQAEVERLKKMVIEAAELGDKRSENFKARAEKAEASLIKINEELCQAGLREYGN